MLLLKLVRFLLTSIGHGDSRFCAAGNAGEFTLVAIGDTIRSTDRVVVQITGKLASLSHGQYSEKEQHDEREKLVVLSSTAEK